MRARWACGRSSCVRRSVRVMSRRVPRGGSRTGRPSRSRCRRFATRRARRAIASQRRSRSRRSARRRSSETAIRRRRRSSSTRRSRSWPEEDDPVAHFDALVARANVGAWRGDMQDGRRYMERAYALALDAGRKDLQTIAAQALAQTHIVRARARRGRAPAHARSRARRRKWERPRPLRARRSRTAGS